MNKAFTLWTHVQFSPLDTMEPIGEAFLSTTGGSNIIIDCSGDYVCHFIRKSISFNQRPYFIDQP